MFRLTTIAIFRNASNFHKNEKMKYSCQPALHVYKRELSAISFLVFHEDKDHAHKNTICKLRLPKIKS